MTRTFIKKLYLTYLMTKTLLAISLIGILMTVIVSHGSFAEAASCRGDCTPPTLGVADNGRRIVSDGFIINGVPFDVESYSQTIPTQVFNVGDKVTVKITAYENGGIKNLKHVNFAITDVKNSKEWKDIAKISLDRSFDGVVIQNIADSTGLIDKVNIKPERIDSFTGSLTISFVVTKPLDTSSITVRMWDAGTGAAANVFQDAIEVVSTKPTTPEEETSMGKMLSSTEQSANPKEDKVKKKMEDQQKLKEEKIRKALEKAKAPMKSKGAPQKYKSP